MRRRVNDRTATTSGTESSHPSATRIRSFRLRLLEWGSAHRRDFPWRQTRDPWKVLVSEVMLQQTQADRVVGYYDAFLRRFPTPADCARAPSADVVRIWSGLGFNPRALGLHRAAGQIVGESRRKGAVRRGGPAAAAGGRALHGSGGAVVRLRGGRRPGRHQCRARSRSLRARRGPLVGRGAAGGRSPGADGPVLGVQPEHVRSGRTGVHGEHAGLRRLPLAPTVPMEA